MPNGRRFLRLHRVIRTKEEVPRGTWRSQPALPARHGSLELEYSERMCASGMFTDLRISLARLERSGRYSLGMRAQCFELDER
jgi:hypothetical protein